MKSKIMDGNRGQVVVQLRPRAPPIERGPNRELGSQEKQISVLDVFSQAVRGAPREISFERLPALTEIVGDIDQGVVIIGAMAVEGNIGPAFLEARRLNGCNITRAGKTDVLG